MSKEAIDKGMFKGARISIKVLDATIISGIIILSTIFLYYFFR